MDGAANPHLAAAALIGARFGARLWTVPRPPCWCNSWNVSRAHLAPALLLATLYDLQSWLPSEVRS